MADLLHTLINTVRKSIFPNLFVQTADASNDVDARQTRLSPFSTANEYTAINAQVTVFAPYYPLNEIVVVKNKKQMRKKGT